MNLGIGRVSRDGEIDAGISGVSKGHHQDYDGCIRPASLDYGVDLTSTIIKESSLLCGRKTLTGWKMKTSLILVYGLQYTL